MKQGISKNKVVFLFYWKLVVMALSRGVGRLPVKLFVKSSRWRLGDCGRAGEAFFNKRACLVLLLFWRFVVLPLFLAGRGGEGMEWFVAMICRFGGDWGSSGAASGREISAVCWPSTSMAEGQPLLPWSLAKGCRRKVYINLQADVPIRRPSTPGTVSSRRCVLSGFVPSDTAVGCAWFELGGDGAGLDCALQIRSEILCAKCQDVFVILFIFEVLYVKCNSADSE
jgi:hypothetical protein